MTAGTDNVVSSTDYNWKDASYTGYGSVIADFFYHKHTHYGFQGIYGFDAFYGFVSCVLLVLAAKQLRKLLMRDEDYYD